MSQASLNGTHRSPVDLLTGFASRTVLVVGDVMLDDYLWGDTHRICPEAPVQIVKIRRHSYRPGGAANVAANVAALGATVWLSGVVGRDEKANQLRTALRESRVNTEGLLVTEDRVTTTKTRVMARNQQMLRLDQEETHPIPSDTGAQLIAQVERQLPHAEAILLCDYAKGVLSASTTVHIIELARRARIPVIVDPKGKDYSRYRGATIIKPNTDELEHLFSRSIQDTDDLHEAGSRLMSELDGTAVLVSRGSEGMTLFSPNMASWHQPAAGPLPVYDVTGAGDTVVSVLALALACRAPLTQAVQLASLAASIVVAKLGTAVVTPDELRSGTRCARNPRPNGGDAEWAPSLR